MSDTLADRIFDLQVELSNAEDELIDKLDGWLVGPEVVYDYDDGCNAYDQALTLKKCHPDLRLDPGCMDDVWASGFRIICLFHTDGMLTRYQYGREEPQRLEPRKVSK